MVQPPATVVPQLEAQEFARIVPAISPDLSRCLRLHGYAVLENVWSTAVADWLSHEAAEVFSQKRVTGGGAGRPQQATASDAPLLAALQFALVPTVRALAGQLLVPSYGWYNFYPTDDGILLHTDVEESDLAVLATVLGEAGPLHLHPELQGMDERDLEAIQNGPEWDRNSGIPTAYPRLGILALRGRRVPHHRPGRPVRSLTAVAALHYRSLL